MTLTIRNLAGFTGSGYDKGRSVPWQIAWLAISGGVLMRWWCPRRLRVAILRMFGAQIGSGVVMKHNVRIHWPWKLTIGENSWIGENAWILNLEWVTIGANVCVSQDVLLCTGSHNRRSPTFEFDNAPIVIEDGVWLAARSTILRGSSIGRDAVIGATALISGVVPAGSIVRAPLGIQHNAVADF